MKAAPLRLDYACPQAATSRAGWLLLAAGIAAAALGANALIEVRREGEQLRVALAKTQRAGPDLRRPRLQSPEDGRRLQLQLSFAEGVAEQLNLPWEALFRALESAGAAEVALLALEPEAKRRTLRIVAEARSKDDMLRYFGRLSASPMLVDVHLVEHQVQAQPGQPVRFSLKASWTGEGS